MSKKDLILVAMPWVSLKRSPIQLGILQAVAARAGFSSATRSFFLLAMEHFAAQTAHLPPGERITTEDFDLFTSSFWRRGLGEWIFAVPPYREPNPERDERYLAYLRSEQVAEPVIAKALQIRELVPSFLQCCVDDILSEDPTVVGFTTCFSQNLASLVLSKKLKQIRPSLQIVFGGANCDGSMGAALHRLFPWVDIVVRGEGEHALPQILSDLLEGRPVRPIPGLCYRHAGESKAVDLDGVQPVPMDDVPVPDYDEYFDRLRRSSLYSKIGPQVRVLFESSRGCWWGEKVHCTFCGLNGSFMKFRSKSGDRVAQEILDLSARHQQVSFEAVDNIIDMQYFNSLLPRLMDCRKLGYDFRLFYETKSNLRKEHLRALRAAGILSIQAGIESISTPILKLMRKGVTGLQNIRTLKWAKLYGIDLKWNLLYGFPGESPSEYERMADVMQSLMHLQPPSTSRLVVERFSPYQQSPEAFSFREIRPSPSYGFLYDADVETLNDLAYMFDYDLIEGRDPSAYVRGVLDVVKAWEKVHFQGGCSLTFRRGPGFMIISDRRGNLESNDFHLGAAEAQIYLSCDAGATPAAVWKSLQANGIMDYSLAEVADFMESLVMARLLYKENDTYLSLALPVNVDVAGPELLHR